MQKDIAVAILGASVGMAGLLLIFAGFLFGQAASFPPETTDDAIINRYRNAGRFGVWPFLLSLLNAAIAFMWMLWCDPLLYGVMVVGFFLSLAFAAVYGATVLQSYL
jgi:hypothetical protein